MVHIICIYSFHMYFTSLFHVASHVSILCLWHVLYLYFSYMHIHTCTIVYFHVICFHLILVIYCHLVLFVYFIYIYTFLFYHILYVFVYFLYFSCVGLKPILSYHIFHISRRSTGLVLLLSSHILSYVFMYFHILYCHIIYGFHLLLSCTVFMY